MLLRHSRCGMHVVAHKVVWFTPTDRLYVGRDCVLSACCAPGACKVFCAFAVVWLQMAA
jgi:hypothetical protein